MRKTQSMAIAAAQWSAPFLFAAPVSIWMAYTLRGDAIEILLWTVIVAFLAAQMSQALIITAAGVWRLATPVLKRPRYWAALAVAEVRSLHLGLRLQFFCMAAISVLIWGVVIIALLLTARSPAGAAVVAAIAGLLATIGWTFSSYVTARNSQRQNTITLLFNMRQSDLYSRHFNNAFLVSQLEQSKRENRAHFVELDEKAKWTLDGVAYDPLERPSAASTVRSSYQSVIYVVNYYEFISVGVRRGALDARIVRETVSPHLRWAGLQYF
jgi:hypothetical protein